MMMAVDGMEEMESMGFVAMNNGVAGYNITDWVLVDENGVIRTDNPENKLVDGYYVYIGTANSETAEPVGSVAAGESTTALFTSVKLSEDAPEIAATSYQIVANFVDADGRLFTYKDVNGNTIEANKDKVPTVDDAGALVVKYTINGVANMTFDSHAKAEAYVLENYSADASFVFDLTVQAYSIQAKEVAYTTERGAYAWVEQFNTDAN